MLYDEAVAAEKTRRWHRATLLACACMSLDRAWVKPLLLRARVCRRLGLWTQAIKDLTSIIRLCPSFTPALLYRSYMYTQTQEFKLALADVNLVLQKQPHATDALLLRSKVYSKVGFVARAIQVSRGVESIERCIYIYIERECVCIAVCPCVSIRYSSIC
jgi:hypothetical protein